MPTPEHRTDRDTLDELHEVLGMAEACGVMRDIERFMQTGGLSAIYTFIDAVRTLQEQRPPLVPARPVPKTDLYFECHVTLYPATEPVPQGLLDEILKRHNFRCSDFHRTHGVEDDAEPETILTGRNPDYLKLERAMVQVISDLTRAGHRVRRYKIENTLLDVRL